jgi:hypothetical protein
LTELTTEKKRSAVNRYTIADFRFCARAWAVRQSQHARGFQPLSA